jgi:hypothetical protein
MSQRRHDRNRTVTHPGWCDLGRCTASSENIHGAHRSTPTSYNADASLARFEVTAALYQAHAPWLTALYAELEFSGLDHDWKATSGRVCLMAEQALELGRFLTDLGQAAVADYDAQIESHRSSLSKEASGR